MQAPLQDGTRCRRRRTQVDESARVAFLQRLQTAVDRRESIGVNIPRQALEQVEVGTKPQFIRRQFHRPMPQAIADVVAADDEIAAAMIGAVHNNVDVRLVSVVVDARDIVESRSDIVLHASHQVAREPFKIQVAAAFGRHNETELVAACRAAFGESFHLVPVEFGGTVEYPAGTAATIDAVALDISQVLSDGFDGILPAGRRDSRFDDYTLRVSTNAANSGAARIEMTPWCPVLSASGGRSDDGSDR